MKGHPVAWKVVLCVALSTSSLRAGQNAAWDLAGTRRLDTTDAAYAIKDGQVVVDLAVRDSQCPSGLGHLASGREPVREIRILYEAPEATRQWLHVTWNPGGSGLEQFEVLCNGEAVGKSERVDAARTPDQERTEVFPVRSSPGKNTVTLKHLSGDGLRFREFALTGSNEPVHKVKGNLQYPTLESFEKAIGRPAVLLEADHVMIFAPQSREAAARIVLPYLVQAYDEFYRIVGVHTKYKIVVYAFPKGSLEAEGGTSECTIRYDDAHLDLNATPEWKYKVPHVEGLIEEMAHNFVDATGVQFGWEMIGWSLSVKVMQKVAPNPIFLQDLQDTRKGQLQTYQRYKAAGHVLPKDVPANQCDRIHAHLLWLAELQYGPTFWPDFFRQVREAKEAFSMAGQSSGNDEDHARNARYHVTIDCFDKLPKIRFRKMLSDNGISLTADVKSLHPEKLEWDRKLR